MRRSPVLNGAYRLVVLTALAAAVTTRLAAQFPGEVSGQVVSAANREPIPDARIEAGGSGISVIADAGGRFRLRGLPPGDWELYVSAIGFTPKRARVSVGDGTVIQRLFELSPAVAVLDPLETVAARLPADAGTSVLERVDLEAIHAPDLATALAGQPGVSVTRRGGPGSPSSISIRGSAPHQVLVVLDGVPLNEPTTGEADLSSVPLDQLERVTIVRGTGAARYGPRALAGALLLERRRADRTEVTGSGTVGSWGEWNGRASGTALLRRGNRTFGLLANASLSRTGGDYEFDQDPVRGGGTARRENDDSRTASLLLGMRADFGGRFVELRGDALDLRRGIPGSIVQPSASARQKERRGGLNLSAGYAAPSGAGWRADLQVTGDQVRYDDDAPPSAAPYHDTTTVTLFRTAITGNRRLAGARWTAGAEARWLDLSSTTLVAEAPPLVKVMSGWLQMRTQRTIGAWESGITADLRVDRDDQLSHARVSPALGLFAGTGDLSLQVSWGMAYAPPTLADRFFQPGVLAQPNPDLRAERVKGEVQAQVTAPNLRLGAARLSTSVSAYRADVDDMILWFPDHRFVWSPDNYDVRRKGMEASTTLTLPVADLTVGGSVSAVAVEYREATLSGQAAYRPQLTAGATVGASVAGLEGGAQYRYVGRRRTVPGSELNTLEPFGTVDMQLSRRLTDRAGLTLTLGVDDVFDRSAAMLPDYPSAGRIWRISLSARTGEPAGSLAPAP